jgi:hypothetical protein
MRIPKPSSTSLSRVSAATSILSGMLKPRRQQQSLFCWKLYPVIYEPGMFQHRRQQQTSPVEVSVYKKQPMC